ncbi:MAG TPA: TorF family putative porin [Burkholderiales bacterium]|nr:TorF family putative porin [Burkholderiales bacterium]
MLRKTLIAAAVTSAFAAPGTLLAADAAPASPHAFTANVGFVSDYSFRGLSQTMGDPAVQGGFDYSHTPTGLYLGTWGSNVSGSEFADGSMEWDFYGGWAKTWGDWGLNVGGLYYYYPGAKLGNGDKYDTFEGYASGSWKWISAKVSYAFTDFFGCNASSCGPNFSDHSDGSVYAELNATYPINDAFSITAHVGHQTVEGTTVDLDYTDYKIGVNYVYNGFNFGLAYKDTDADSSLYTLTKGSGKQVDLSEGKVIVSVTKTF